MVIMLRFVLVVCIVLFTVDSGSAKKNKAKKDYDCTSEVRASMVDWLNKWREDDWKAFGQYYHEDIMYMRYDEPTYFGRKKKVKLAQTFKKDYPGVDLNTHVSEAFCTDKKTAVGIVIFQKSAFPERYTRILAAWRYNKRAGRWQLIREAVVGSQGSLKSDQEFARWKSPDFF